MKFDYKTIFLFVLAIYLVVAVLTALTLLPNCDETWFTQPGFNLFYHGFFGTTVLDESAGFRQVRLEGINHFTYWIMPLYPLLQGVWSKIFGIGLPEVRSVSVLSGLTALFSWSYLIKKLSGNRMIALAAIGLLAVDYHFIYAAGSGRMDMTTAALGVGGLAVFAAWREKNFNRAVFCSFCLTAFAGFTHPLGLIWAINLATLIILLDVRQIRVRHVALAAAPYFVLGFLWSLYIWQRPDLFAIQFGGNASDRWGFLHSPFSEIWRDIVERYLANFGIGAGLSQSGQIKILILTGYLISIVGILAVKDLRRQVFTKFLIVVAIEQFFLLLLLDGLKQSYYMIHITPTLTTILAVWLGWLWTRNKFLKLTAATAFVGILTIGASVNLLRIRHNDYQNYLTVGKILNEKSKPSDLIMASSELWFALQNRETLLDDYRLGYKTGKRADFILIDAPRYRVWQGNLIVNEPDVHQYIENLLQTDYELIYEDKIYLLYRRK